MPETPELIIFYILAATAVLFAFLVVTGRNLVRLLLSFSLFLLTVAGIFFLLGAPLLGVIQIFVYVGGVVVMVLFGIMLTPNLLNIRLPQGRLHSLAAIILSVGLVAIATILIGTADFQMPDDPGAPDALMVIGEALMSGYVFPFEVLALVLLAAVLGAVAIVGEKDGDDDDSA